MFRAVLNFIFGLRGEFLGLHDVSYYLEVLHRCGLWRLSQQVQIICSLVNYAASKGTVRERRLVSPTFNSLLIFQKLIHIKYIQRGDQEEQIVSYLWMQDVDAVVGQEEDLERPQSHERPGAHLPHLVSTQVQQPAAVGDILRDLVQPASPAVHQVRGLVAQTGGGAEPEARHDPQDRQQRNHAKHHATTREHLSGVKERPSPAQRHGRPLCTSSERCSWMCCKHLKKIPIRSGIKGLN